MPTVTIELDDATHAYLESEAVREGRSVGEVLAGLAVARLMEGEADAARAAARRHLTLFPRVFSRLAE